MFNHKCMTSSPCVIRYMLFCYYYIFPKNLSFNALQLLLLSSVFRRFSWICTVSRIKRLSDVQHVFNVPKSRRFFFSAKHWWIRCEYPIYRTGTSLCLQLLTDNPVCPCSSGAGFWCSGSRAVPPV